MQRFSKEAMILPSKPAIVKTKRRAAARRGLCIWCFLPRGDGRYKNLCNLCGSKNTISRREWYRAAGSVAYTPGGRGRKVEIPEILPMLESGVASGVAMERPSREE